MSKINNKFYKALELKYAYEIEDAVAKMSLLFDHPVGISEHVNITEEMDRLLGIMGSATEKVFQLRKHFGITVADHGEIVAPVVPKTTSL
jgi:hypothetical protein|tara:strand:+ start:3423 stop:3692 length:270 start_codon:yes stop_codon:yes gene_type:complete